MTLDTSKKQFIALFVALFVVLADQLLKYWARVNLSDGTDMEVTSWFKLCYVQNPGAAFGMTFGPKILLTLFRIFAVGCLSYCTYRIVRRKDFPLSFVVGFVLITAGAAGNIIDCVLYAKLFDGGDWFVGKVIDMLYFPIVRSTFPDWFPWRAGQSFVFFSPVFNLADAAITCGTFYLMIFHFKRLSNFMDLCIERLKDIFVAGTDKLVNRFSKKKGEIDCVKKDKNDEDNQE